MKRNTPTVAAITTVVSAGLALVFLRLNLIQSAVHHSVYVAALVGALIGAGFFLVFRLLFPTVLEKSPQLARRNLPVILAGVFAAIAVAVIGSLADLWSLRFMPALGWGMAIGVTFGIVYWLAYRFVVAKT